MVIAVTSAFIVSVTIAIGVVNARGGDLLARYFAEYAGGGSCKWRGAEGRAFESLLQVGLLAWPVGLCLIAVELQRARRAGVDRAGARWGSLLIAVVVALALTRLATSGALHGALHVCLP